MGRIIQVKDIEARKRALAAGSEACRQALKLELHNLRLYGSSLQRKLNPIHGLGPLLMLGAPLAASFLRRKQPKWLRLVETALVGWRLYRRFAPILSEILPRRKSRMPADEAVSQATI